MLNYHGFLSFADKKQGTVVGREEVESPELPVLISEVRNDG